MLIIIIVMIQTSYAINPAETKITGTNCEPLTYITINQGYNSIKIKTMAIWYLGLLKSSFL